MVKLIPSQPKESFFWSWSKIVDPTFESKKFLRASMYPNLKLYPWAMAPELLAVLDQEKFHWIDLRQIWDVVPNAKTAIFVRHLESMYNQYKVLIRKTTEYKEFKSTNDPVKKDELAEFLRSDFIKRVGSDYMTDISDLWHQQWALLGKLYAKLIEIYPDIFPTLILVSPYKRTRLTAYYMLKEVKWLDLDLEFLTDFRDKRDMVIWSFNGKEIVLKFDNNIRERDHGREVAPSFLRDYFESKNNTSIDYLSDDDTDLQHYFTIPNWGESQVWVEQRIKVALNSIFSDPIHNNILVISHHLAILAALNNIFSWSYNTFYNLDKNWKPDNTSLTVLAQIPQTDSWQENKVRVAWYNMKLVE